MIALALGLGIVAVEISRFNSSREVINGSDLILLTYIPINLPSGFSKWDFHIS